MVIPGGGLGFERLLTVAWHHGREGVSPSEGGGGGLWTR